jgi:hypothetical protein
MTTSATPDNISQVTAYKFSTVLYQLAQQRVSKFGSKVRREPVSGYELAYFDTIGVEDAPEPAVTRHGATPLSEGTFGRRKATPAKWHKARMLDSYDLLRMQEDVQGATMEAFSASFARKLDDIIIAASVGTALTGKDGTGPQVKLADESIGLNGTTGGVRTVIGTGAIPSTPVGLELAKMLAMLQIFNEADVDADLEKYWAVSPQDISYMLNLTQVGSADYNTVKALAAGKVETYAGFKFFWTNRLLTVTDAGALTNPCNQTIAFVEKGIVLATIGEMTSQITQRPDLCNENQIYSKMDLGSVRMEGAMVHECLTKQG